MTRRSNFGVQKGLYLLVTAMLSLIPSARADAPPEQAGAASYAAQPYAAQPYAAFSPLVLIGYSPPAGAAVPIPTPTDTPIPAPYPTPAIALEAARQELQDYRAPGLWLQTYLEQQAEATGVIAIALDEGFTSSDPQMNTRYHAILAHLQRFHFTSTALEDVPEARELCAQLGLRTLCQFWNADLLKRMGSQQVVYSVMKHETAHNVQAAHDPLLAEHVRGNPEDPLLAVYRALIEGAAEDPKMGGCPVGGSSYEFYRQLYAAFKAWAARTGREEAFRRLCLGDFAALEPFLEAYDQAGGDWHALLNRLYCRYRGLAAYGRIEYSYDCSP